MKRRRDPFEAGELPPIDWLEVHRLGLQGARYSEARQAGTLTREAQAAAAAVGAVHLARNTPRSHEAYARRRAAALEVLHLVPVRR